MPNIVVNVFSGTDEQDPVRYELTGLSVYQDIITTLITAGYYPGQVLSLSGERVPLRDPISLLEVNYIEPKQKRGHILKIKRAETGELSTFSYGKESTYQDLESMMIFQFGYDHYLSRQSIVHEYGSWTTVEYRVPKDPHVTLYDLFHPEVGKPIDLIVRKYRPAMWITDAGQSMISAALKRVQAIHGSPSV